MYNVRRCFPSNETSVKNDWTLLQWKFLFDILCSHALIKYILPKFVFLFFHWRNIDILKCLLVRRKESNIWLCSQKENGKNFKHCLLFCRVQKLLIWSLTSIRSCTCEYSNNYLRIKQHTTQNVVFVTIKYFITPLHFQTRQMKMIPIRFFLKIKGLE